jgi:L-serine dehydratase
MGVASIFNDVIGPVMRGPSSSHLAAALRIGRLARDLMDGALSDVLVEFDREGSLPTTHESQGSDMGLFGGLLGWEADDDRLPNAARWLREAGIQLAIAVVDAGDPHPNTYRLTLASPRERHSLIAISTGGGMIEVLSIDGAPTRMDGGWCETLAWTTGAAPAPPDIPGATARVHPIADGHLVHVQGDAFATDEALAPLRPVRVRRLSRVLPVPSRAGVRVPFDSSASLVAHDGARQTPLWQLAVDYEMARGGISADEAHARMLALVRLLRKSIAQGIAGTTWDDRMLHHQSGRFAEAMAAGRLLDGGALNRIVLHVAAMMEVKSAMGVIIAAPTAGACAALPGAVTAMAEHMGASEDEMARAMLAAGLIGVIITTRWTFAAEVGGCQAEGGSAAAMAAAALVTLAGGTRDQALAAASLALQSMLGLICDPVAARVEAPCLGKNVLAASNALSCANMALAGFDPLIPFDEVVDAARSVAERMPREHRCTSLGGLAMTPTALRLSAHLAARKAAAEAAALTPA